MQQGWFGVPSVRSAPWTLQTEVEQNTTRILIRTERSTNHRTAAVALRSPRSDLGDEVEGAVPFRHGPEASELQYLDGQKLSRLGSLWLPYTSRDARELLVGITGRSSGTHLQETVALKPRNDGVPVDFPSNSGT